VSRPVLTVSSCLTIGESHACQTRGSAGHLGNGDQDKNCGSHLGSSHGGSGTRGPMHGPNGNPPSFPCASSLFTARALGFVVSSSSSSCPSLNLGWILRACGQKSEQEDWKGTAGGVDDLLSRWSSPDPLRSLWFLLDLVGDGEEMGLDQAVVEEGVADSAILGTLGIDMAVEVAMSSHRIGQRHLGLKNRKGILIRKRNPLMWLCLMRKLGGGADGSD
jgi:hypothetical protein